MEKHPLNLKDSKLHTSRAVSEAVARAKRHTKKRIPNNPTERIQSYIDRLEDVFLNPDRRIRARNLGVLRNDIYNALIIKRENFPESYFELQKRVAREQGHGDITISLEMREQMIDTVIQDQKHSLDAWIDYLSSDDAMYPAWFKYYVWTQATKLSQFDKERGEFKKRTVSTVAPFPDIYREPLAQIADLYERFKNDNKDSEARQEFDKKFSSLYAELIQKSLAAAMEGRETIEGSWVLYEQNDDTAAQRLFESLEGKGTGWCTAGRSTAETQIESGDFYVYYTHDTQGDPVQPRLAIRMEGKNKIAEVRGILPNQHVEPLLQDVLEEKLTEFGAEADVYRKKSADMRHLTTLENKHKENISLTKEDLLFLYEIDSKIQGFGYKPDPRISDLREGRDVQKDILVVFECTEDEIAYTPDQIRESTKVYIGALTPNIFAKLSHVEHVYANFPEQKFERITLNQIGGEDGATVLNNIQQKFKKDGSGRVSNRAQSMHVQNGQPHPEFEAHRLHQKQDVHLVRLSVRDIMGEAFWRTHSTATTQQIYARFLELGLDWCPPEVGAQLWLQNKVIDWTFVGMKQIRDSDGSPGVLVCYWNDDEPWFDRDWADPDYEWDAGFRFVFRVRKES